MFLFRNSNDSTKFQKPFVLFLNNNVSIDFLFRVYKLLAPNPTNGALVSIALQSILKVNQIKQLPHNLFYSEEKENGLET